MPTQTKVMVAEDDRAFREVLLMAIEGIGFDALPAVNAREVLATLESCNVALLLLDLRLGDDNGIEILKEARKHPAASKPAVLLITGNSDQKSVLEAAKLGVKGYLRKQELNHADLLARIHQCIDEGPRPPAPAALETPAQPIRKAAPTPAPANPQLRPQASPPVQADDRAESRDKLQQLKPIITRDEVLAAVEKESGLKAFSPTVMQLLDMTNRPDYSLEEIARVIKRDPAIAVKVLKIANSVVYTRTGGIDSVQKALSRVGLAQVRQLVLNISVVDRYQFHGLGDFFNSQMFWEHSIATGLIAAAITRFRDGDDRAIDAAFTAGLLHDVGRILLAEQLSDVYKTVAETARRDQLPLEQVEMRMLRCSHADLLERTLKTWGFPADLIEPIAMHHMSMTNIRGLSPRSIGEIGALAMANRLAHAMLLGSTGNDSLYPTEDFAEVLGLTPEAMAFIEERIPEQASDVKFAMLQSAPSAAWPDYCQRVRTRLAQPIRTLYVSGNPTMDGYRMMFQRLSDAAGQAPNLAVLHLAEVGDRRNLQTKLLESEKNAGVELLPLIAITSSTAPHFDSNFLSGRVFKVVPSPFTLSRLIDAMNGLLGGHPDQTIKAGQ
jgi:HD-like signal output (HDOD) protein/CheY-like chemotaxis protein